MHNEIGGEAVNHFSISCGGIEFSHAKNEDAPENLNTNHCHGSYEILYVIEGSGCFVVEGNEYQMRPGSLLITRPYQYHFVNVQREKPYERFVIHFDLEVLPESLRCLFADAKQRRGEECTYFSAGTVPGAVLSTLSRFDVVSTLSDEKKALFLPLLVAEVIVLLSDASGERETVYSDGLGARVIRYLNDHIEQNISLDDIAKHFFVSKYYLCRAFKKHNGISIHGYVTHKRVMLAKLLIESGESASGAAYRVGFGDYSAFYRAYVKILGVSPVSGRGERREHGE